MLIQLIVSHHQSKSMPEKPIAALIEKIAKECEEANADKWTITRIVKQLSLEEQAGIKALRKKALEMLQQLDPKAAGVYASFQKMEVRTSSQIVEGFDRGNIIKSLLRETEVARGVAEKIGREVEEKIKDLEIESISTALIREMVNVKLLEYGHENIRNQYARLGLPVFEVKKKTEQRPYGNRAIMAEYNLLRKIPKGLARMHLSNELFIAEMQDFCTKPITACIEADCLETPRETVFGILETANRLKGFVSWQPNLSGLNLAISTSSGKKNSRETASLFSRAARAVFPEQRGAPAFNVLHLFEPDSFKGKSPGRESLASATNTLIRDSMAGGTAFKACTALDTKYKLKLLNKVFPKMLLNSKNGETNLANGIALKQKGICSFTALNLSRIAASFKGNETAFFEELARKAKAAAQLDELKREELSGKSYVKKNGLALQEFASVLALDSLFKSSKAAIETEKESEALSFSEKVLGFLSKQLPENFVLVELTSGPALERFGKKGIEPEEKHLRKSKAICKNYCFSAMAESKREINELIDNNVKMIEFEPKEN